MVVLGMDTATHVLAVGIGTEERVIGGVGYSIPRGHSRLLQPVVQQVLTDAGMAPRDVTMLGVGIGPGSYTGVRMAVSTAKAMAFALDIPVVPVSTLWMMAEAIVPYETSVPTVVIPLLYARRERAFGAVYEKTGKLWRCTAPAQVRPFQDWLADAKELSSVVGPYDSMGPQESHGTTGTVGTAGTLGLRQCIIVHDFSPRTGLLESLQTFRGGAIVHVDGLMGGLGPALVRIAASGQAAVVQGELIHTVVPEYALQVEAEVKLEAKRTQEKGDDRHGNPGV